MQRNGRKVARTTEVRATTTTTAVTTTTTTTTTGADVAATTDTGPGHGVLDVQTGAEARARTREDHDSDAAVALHPFDGGTELVEHPYRDRVAAMRSVQRDGGDVTIDVVEDLRRAARTAIVGRDCAHPRGFCSLGACGRRGRAGRTTRRSAG